MMNDYGWTCANYTTALVQVTTLVTGERIPFQAYTVGLERNDFGPGDRYTKWLLKVIFKADGIAAAVNHHICQSAPQHCNH